MFHHNDKRFFSLLSSSNGTYWLIEHFKTIFSYFYLLRHSKCRCGKFVQTRKHSAVDGPIDVHGEKIQHARADTIIKVAPLRFYEIVYRSPFDRVHSHISTPITNACRVLFTYFAGFNRRPLLCTLDAYTWTGRIQFRRISPPHINHIYYPVTRAFYFFFFVHIIYLAVYL